jgi:putative ABC transport system permease protein
MFRRDWRAGELRLAALALLLAVAAVTTVGFVQDRVAAALVLGAARLTAGDLVLAGDQPAAATVVAQAQANGLVVSQSAAFSSMLRGPTHSVLVQVKAVSANFPLRGALRLRGSQRASGKESSPPPAIGSDPRDSLAPAPGTAFLAPGLAARLGLAPGDTLALGHAILRVGGEIAEEPDSGLSAFRIAPRVLIAQSDLARTELIRPGSRVSWRLAVAGTPAQLAAWRKWLEPRLLAGERLDSPAESRPEVRSLIDQAGQFLRLSSLASVLLASVALLFALRRQVERQRDTVAILRCLGASGRQVLLMQSGAVLILGVFASVAGVLLGFLLQEGLARILAPLVDVALPWPGPGPALEGLAVGGLLLAGFALPGLRALGQVPALQVLRPDAGQGAAGLNASWPRRIASWSATLLPGGIALLLVASLGSARPLLALATLGALAAVAALAAVCTRGLIALCTHLLPTLPLAWRQGLRSLARRPAFASLQAGALSVGLLVLLVLGLVRNDLMATWQASLPTDAPNHFILGVQPDERTALTEFLLSAGHPGLDLRPLVRARLVAINGQAIDLARITDPRERALLDREFNLTWAAQMNPDNRLIAGHWWSAQDPDGGLSLEKGFAERLHLQVGSHLRFDVAGVDVESTVASLRTVRWDSFQPNFFVIARPGLLDGADASYIASFHLPVGDLRTGDLLAARFPQISLIDTGAVLGQVRELTAQVAMAVEFVFALSLVAGLLVLLAGIQATHDERLREGALLRALGATRRQLRAMQSIEFGILGASAGLCAAGGALLLSWLISTRLLDLEWHADWRIPLFGTLIGLLLVGVTAALALRPLGRALPAESLRLFS